MRRPSRHPRRDHRRALRKRRLEAVDRDSGPQARVASILRSSSLAMPDNALAQPSTDAQFTSVSTLITAQQPGATETAPALAFSARIGPLRLNHHADVHAAQTALENPAWSGASSVLRIDADKDCRGRRLRGDPLDVTHAAARGVSERGGRLAPWRVACGMPMRLLRRQTEPPPRVAQASRRGIAMPASFRRWSAAIAGQHLAGHRLAAARARCCFPQRLFKRGEGG